MISGSTLNNRCCRAIPAPVEPSTGLIPPTNLRLQPDHPSSTIPALPVIVGERPRISARQMVGTTDPFHSHAVARPNLSGFAWEVANMILAELLGNVDRGCGDLPD